MKKYLFTGGSGLIGSYLVKNYSQIANPARILFPSHGGLDITDSGIVNRYFNLHKPSIAINLAAHRNASTAESQRGNKDGNVWKTNVVGAKNIANACKEYGSYLIHISTDYVFSGHKNNPGPYSEKDTPEKNDDLLSWYGITKREGESAILNTLSNAAIIRINNVTRPNNKDLKLDYIGKFLWLYEQKKLYPVFDDQNVTLTYIPMITQMIDRLIKTGLTGIYHAASADTCTPFELASYTIKKLHGHVNVVRKITMDSFLQKNPRRYPKFGGLKTEITQRKLGIKPMKWHKIVDIFIKETKLL